jgi:quercetin dioxygenase-like cupin family protein
MSLIEKRNRSVRISVVETRDGVSERGTRFVRDGVVDERFISVESVREESMSDTPFVRGGDEGRATWFLGTLVVDRVTAEDSGGAFSVTEHLLAPNYETPYHRHHGEEEMFYLLEGELTLYTEDGMFTATAGETVILPRERPHGYRVTSDVPARKLVFVAPAGFEQFFHEAGVSAATRDLPEPTEPDVERLGALAPDYDLELLGPLPEPAE